MTNKVENIFLTFLILTYKRPEKVKRLLEQFLDERWKNILNLKLEIIIADDYSCDNTKEILEPLLIRLINFGWKVEYILREHNLKGDYNLYKGLYDDSSGEYTWFLCDDDCIVIQEAIIFLQNVFHYKPFVAICGFKQGKSNEYSNNLGNKIRMSNSFEDSIELISHYPKTSTYIFKRVLKDLTLVNFERWNGTLYAWIGLGIYMIGRNDLNGVLVYPYLTVYADDEYGELRYSYRVFKNLNFVIRDSINLIGIVLDDEFYKLPFLQEDDELSLNILGLQAHYSIKTDITYSEIILRQEIKYFKNNVLKIFLKPRRLILTSKFVYVRISDYFKNN